MKNKFITFYVVGGKGEEVKVKKTTEKEIPIEIIENNLSQTLVKSAHSNWLIWICSFLTSDKVKICQMDRKMPE